jgi:hypothetical protein
MRVCIDLESTTMKKVEEVTIADFAKYPVWEYVGCEPIVAPVLELPVDSLQNRVVGAMVQLANGNKVWASLSNISLKEPRLTKQFLTISIEKEGVWFHLSRYFDVDYHRRGPKQLAEFLGLPLNSVFPIEYDLSNIVFADISLIKGSILLEPDEKLSEDEIIELSVAMGRM